MELLTINQVAEKIGVKLDKRESVGWQESRIILQYIDTPCVIAYGAGFCGFIVIFKTGMIKGKRDMGLRAATYSQHKPLSSCSMSGFSAITIKEAKEALETRKGFAEKLYDGKDIDESEKEYDPFIRPTIGKITIQRKESVPKKASYNAGQVTNKDKEYVFYRKDKEYVFYRLKNGGIRIESEEWSSMKRVAPLVFLEDYKQSISGEKTTGWNDAITTRNIKENSIPPEILEELLSRITLSAI